MNRVLVKGYSAGGSGVRGLRPGSITEKYGRSRSRRREKMGKKRKENVAGRRVRQGKGLSGVFWVRKRQYVGGAEESVSLAERWTMGLGVKGGLRKRVNN